MRDSGTVGGAVLHHGGTICIYNGVMVCNTPRKLQLTRAEKLPTCEGRLRRAGIPSGYKKLKNPRGIASLKCQHIFGHDTRATMNYY